MEHKFAKYLKEGCRLSSNGELFFKYFLNIAVASDLVSRRCSPGFPVSYTTYHWLLTVLPKYGRKSDDYRNIV